MAWYECGEKLAAPLPVTEAETKKVLHTLAEESVDKSPDFLLLSTAVIAAESGFNRLAQSPMGATGLMQLTMIGAKEAAKQCRLSGDWGSSDTALQLSLLSSRTNVKYGTCLLRFYLDQVKGNSILALVLYNGGYAQLTRFLETGTLTEETSKYVLRVHSFLGRCQ